MISQKFLDAIVAMDQESQKYEVEIAACDIVQVAQALTNRPKPLVGDIVGFVEAVNAVIPVSHIDGAVAEGFVFHYFQIGRDLSRVIYLEIPHAYVKPTQLSSIKNDMNKLSTLFECDEHGFVSRPEQKSTAYRFWWD